MKALVLAALLGATIATAPASAAVMTSTYTFDATFRDGPYATVTGGFTITHDPEYDAGKLPVKAAEVTNFFSSLPTVYNSNIDFLDAGQVLIFGNNCSSRNCPASRSRPTFTAAFQIDQNGTNPVGLNFAYSVQDQGIFQAASIGFSRTASVDAVPEPATWAMMIGGFGLIGATARRRKVKTTVSYA